MPAVLSVALSALIALASAPAPQLQPSVQDERAAIEKAIAAYNDSLVAGDSAKFRASVAGHIFMFNGAASPDPTAWEAHMYVAPERLEQFSKNFVEGAGPHVNTYKVLSVNVRANAAVVSTSDTGHNRFRSWTDERITWMVGKRDGAWKIVGFFIPGANNPK